MIGVLTAGISAQITSAVGTTRLSPTNGLSASSGASLRTGTRSEFLFMPLAELRETSFEPAIYSLTLHNVMLEKL